MVVLVAGDEFVTLDVTGDSFVVRTVLVEVVVVILVVLVGDDDFVVSIVVVVLSTTVVGCRVDVVSFALEASFKQMSGKKTKA